MKKTVYGLVLIAEDLLISQLSVVNTEKEVVLRNIYNLRHSRYTIPKSLIIALDGSQGLFT